MIGKGFRGVSLGGVQTKNPVLLGIVGLVNEVIREPIAIEIMKITSLNGGRPSRVRVLKIPVQR